MYSSPRIATFHEKKQYVQHVIKASSSLEELLENLKKLSFSHVSLDFFYKTPLFFKCLCEQPTKTKELIENDLMFNRMSIENNDNHNLYLLKYLQGSLRQAFLPLDNYVACMEFLLGTSRFHFPSWHTETGLPLEITLILERSAQQDNAVIMLAWIKLVFPLLSEKLRQDLIEKAFYFSLKEDSGNTFKALCKSYRTPEENLSRAVYEAACRCVTALLSDLSEESIQGLSVGINRLARKAAKEGRGDIVLALYQGNRKRTAETLFGDLFIQTAANQKNDEKAIAPPLREQLWKIMRLSSPEEIDRLMAIFLNQHPNILLETVYRQVKEDFYCLSPLIARYSKPLYFISVFGNYHSYERYIVERSKLDAQLQLEAGMMNDYAYSMQAYQFAKKLQKALEDKLTGLSTFKKSDFSQLPPSWIGNQWAAFLLELISEWRSLQVENKKRSSFRNLRKQVFSTPIKAQYEWAFPLVSSVYLYSKASDLQRNVYNTNDISSNCPNNLTFLYQKKQMNQIQWQSSRRKFYWGHGLQPLHTVWQHIEDTLEEIRAVPVHSPEDLTYFWALVAKFVWLSANIQPLDRGSGTYAEQMLRLLFSKKGLQPPILELDFPHLDVLSLSFPLTDYIFRILSKIQGEL